MSLNTVLLRDEFSDDRAAGAINNTLATDGINTRTVTDSGSKLSISGGKLISSGAVGWGDPRISWPAIARQAGQVVALNFSAPVSWSYTAICIRPALDNYGNHGVGTTTSSIVAVTNTSYEPIVTGSGYIAAGANYRAFMAVRSSGYMTLFRRPGEYPLLHFIYDIGSHSPYYAQITRIQTSEIDYDNLTVAGYWLPTPLVSDGFGSAFGNSDGLGHAETSGIGSGGSGVAWSNAGGGWSVSGGKAINTPTLGSELVTNGDFAVDANWTGAGWTISGGAAHAATASTSNLTQASILQIGTWYSVQFTISNRTAGSIWAFLGSSGQGSAIHGTNGAKLGTGRCVGDTTLYLQALGAITLDIDNVSVKALTLSSLFSSVTISTADVYAGVDVVVTSGTQAGMVLNLDSTSSPANLVVAYHDGTNCKLEKCVAGTWTTVLSAASTYSAGMRLVVSKIGTAYRVYTVTSGTATLVGSATISDAGIVSNTKHGLFSTDSSNTLDNFVVYASGSGGEYNSDLQIVMSNERTSAMSLADSLLKVPVKILSDILSLSDSALRTIIKSEPVQTALSSVAVKVPVKMLSDILSLSDSVLRTIIKSEAVQMAIDSTATKTVIKIFGDGIAFTRAQAINYGKRIIRIIRLLGNIGAN